MIEIRNIRAYDDKKSIRENRFSRIHKKDTITGVVHADFEDEDGQYAVKIYCKNTSNLSGLFDTSEKASKFYDALKSLLPDSDTQNAVIDHKDFE